MLQPMKIHSDLKNFKYVCSVQSEFMAVFVGFNLWIGQDFIFDPCS